MHESLASLRHKIKGVNDLRAVVRTMKAMAAATVGPCENALTALADYRRAVELGLGIAYRRFPSGPKPRRSERPSRIDAIVFGTDQGMVGQFNEQLAELALGRLAQLGGTAAVWVVGERMKNRLEDAGVAIAGSFSAPGSVAAITPHIAELLVALESARELGDLEELHLFHNRPRERSGYDPVGRQLLPLDEAWCRQIESTPWPGRAVPEIIADDGSTFDALIREHLFVSLFATSAESLAAENARRFAAMQGAERNIGERLDILTRASNRQRQETIDEELFDLVAGYQVLLNERAGR